MKNRRRHAGFNVLELMAVLSVVGILMAIAVPGFRQYMLNNRMTSTANDLLVAVHTARTEAIKRHVQVVVCLSSNPNDEEDAPVCDGDGTQGWIVFVDDADPESALATDGNGEVDDDEEVLVRHGAAAEGVTFSADPAESNYVAYDPAGFRRPIAELGEDLNALVICDERGNEPIYGDNTSTARALAVSVTGRPIVTRDVGQIEGFGGC